MITVPFDLFLKLHGMTWDDADIGNTAYTCIGNICHCCGYVNRALADAKRLLSKLSMFWSHLVSLKGADLEYRKHMCRSMSG